MEEDYPIDIQRRNSANLTADTNSIKIYEQNSILEAIFEFLPSEDLRICRLVNKLWKGEADRTLSSRQSVTLLSIEDMENLITKLASTKTSYKVCELRLDGFSIQNVSETFLTLLKRVMKNITDLVMVDIRMTQQIFNQIMQLVGHRLRRLELATLKTETGNYFSYFPLLENPSSSTPPSPPLVFPNLRSLEYISFLQDHNNPSGSTTLAAVAALFPNLVELIVNNPPIEEPSQFLNLRFDSLAKLEIKATPYNPDPTPGALHIGPWARAEQNLREYGIRDRHLQAFINMKLPSLKEVSLFNFHPSVPNDVLQKFLETFKDTLETISLRNSSLTDAGPSLLLNGASAPTPFPTNLPNVTYIYIEKPYIRNLNHVLNSLPKLEEIVFGFPVPTDENEDIGLHWSRILPAKITNHPTLNSLGLCRISPKQLTVIARGLTRISTFVISGCDNALLRVIFTEMTHLRALVLRGDPKLPKLMFNDEGITGLPHDVLISMKKPKKSTMLQFRKSPSICDMKNLKVATILCCEGITHKSLNFGFFLMRDIESFSVAMDLKKIPKSCRDFMWKRGFRYEKKIVDPRVCVDRLLFVNTKGQYWQSTSLQRLGLTEEQMDDYRSSDEDWETEDELHATA